MEKKLNEIIKAMFGKTMGQCSDRELYLALLEFTRKKMQGKKRITGTKKVYYISAEFLIGKLLANNLINLKL